MNDISEKKSNILLLCLGFDQPKAVVSSIRVRDLLHVFHPFGAVKKIMIFSKTTIAKAFIEFADADTAEAVKDMMHETCIDNFGKARLYFSDREQIVCSHNFLDYWDASMPVCREGLTSQSTREELLASAGSSPLGRDFALSSGHISPFKLTANTSPGHLNSLNHSCGFEPQDDPGRWVLGENKVLLKRFSLNSALGLPRPADELPPDLRSAPPLPSRVVLVSNIENFFGSAREVFNLFSCFGNLNKVLFMKNLQKALIEFGSVESGQRCIDHINKRQIDALTLRVSFSKYQKIDLKKSNKTENSQQYNDVFVVPAELNRFILNGAKFCPPSPLVLVALEKRDGLNNTDACLLIKDAVKALGLPTSGEKIDYQDPRFAKIIFHVQSVHNSILIISKLHGLNVKNCPLSVSFCA